jgi:hypothetical protein
MWITVYRATDGAKITTATFSVAAYNQGDGWYYMYIGAGQSFCVSAPGYYTVCGNTDSYSSMWASLAVYTPPPPPPPPPPTCWS